jgi:hypothetical protein
MYHCDNNCSNLPFSLDTVVLHRAPYSLVCVLVKVNVTHNMPIQAQVGGARRGWVINTTPWPLYPQERAPVPIVEEAEWAWAPGPVSTCMEKSMWDTSLPTLGFEPWTVWPVVSCYINYTILACPSPGSERQQQQIQIVLIYYIQFATTEFRIFCLAMACLKI